MAQDYQPDEERSLSRTFFVLSLILVVVSLYTVVDETFVRRPWKHYQTTFYELEYDRCVLICRPRRRPSCPAKAISIQDSAGPGCSGRQCPVP